MEKEFKVFATFREICGGKTVRIPYEEHEPIGQLLDKLIDRFPQMGEELFTENKAIRQHVHVFINGRNVIFLDGLKTTVKPEDELALFPPVAGG